MENALVIYYSQSSDYAQIEGADKNYKGNTQIAAEAIRDALGCDLFRIELDDISVNSQYHSSKMSKSNGVRPTLKSYLDDISKYDYVYVCGPSWYRTYPAAIFSLLERLDFKGKKVMCLVTHEGSGISECMRDLRMVCKGATFGRSFDVIGSNVKSAVGDIAEWAISETK